MPKQVITLNDGSTLEYGEVVFCNPADPPIDRVQHRLLYLGKAEGKYKCGLCGDVIAKEDLRELTN